MTKQQRMVHQKNFTNKFRADIKYAMFERGLTFRGLSTLTGISSSYLCHLVNHPDTINLGQLRTLSNVLQLPYHNLAEACGLVGGEQP